MDANTGGSAIAHPRLHLGELKKMFSNKKKFRKSSLLSKLNRSDPILVLSYVHGKNLKTKQRKMVPNKILSIINQFFHLE